VLVITSTRNDWKLDLWKRTKLTFEKDDIERQIEELDKLTNRLGWLEPKYSGLDQTGTNVVTNKVSKLARSLDRVQSYAGQLYAAV
jgi:hypothetical protein